MRYLSSLSGLWSLSAANLAKIVDIFEIYADLSKKYKTVEVISLYPA